MIILTTKSYFYIRVIEVKEVVIKSLYAITEPFVRAKLNGIPFQKRATSYHIGREWFDRIFRFNIHNQETDWILVEVRDKCFSLFGSDWIGEVRLEVKDYLDGEVHQKWFALESGNGKHRHRKPRGSIHLQLHLTNSKVSHPFNSKPIEPILTFEKWLAFGGGSNSPYSAVLSELESESSKSSTSDFFENVIQQEDRIGNLVFQKLKFLWFER